MTEATGWRESSLVVCKTGLLSSVQSVFDECLLCVRNYTRCEEMKSLPSLELTGD